MKIYFDENLKMASRDYDESYRGTTDYDSLSVYVPQSVVQSFNAFGVNYYAALPDGDEIGAIAMGNAQLALITTGGVTYYLWTQNFDNRILAQEGSALITIEFAIRRSSGGMYSYKTACALKYQILHAVTLDDDIIVSDTDSYQNVVTSMKQSIDTIASGLNAKVAITNMGDYTYSPKFENVKTAKIKAKASDDVNITMDDNSVTISADECDGDGYVDITTDNSITLTATNAISLYTSALKWGNDLLATRNWVTGNYYTATQSDNKYVKLAGSNMIAGTNTFVSGGRVNFDGEIDSDGSNTWNGSNTFAIAPIIQQTPQSNNSAVTKAYVTSQISEAMKEHIIDYWFQADGNKIYLYQKLSRLNADGSNVVLSKYFTMPDRSIVSNVTYNQNTMKLLIDFENGQDIEINLSNLRDTYGVENNGHTITMSLENGKFSADLSNTITTQLEAAFSNENIRIANEQTRIANYNAFFGVLNDIGGALCAVSFDSATSTLRMTSISVDIDGEMQNQNAQG